MSFTRLNGEWITTTNTTCMMVFNLTHITAVTAYRNALICTVKVWHQCSPSAYFLASAVELHFIAYSLKSKIRLFPKQQCIWWQTISASSATLLDIRFNVWRRPPMDDLTYIWAVYAHSKGYIVHITTRSGALLFPNEVIIESRMDLRVTPVYMSTRRNMAKFGAPTGSVNSSFSEE